MKPITKSSLTDKQKLYIAGQLLVIVRENNWPEFITFFADDVSCSMPGENILSGKENGLAYLADLAKKIANSPFSTTLNNIQLSYQGFAWSIKAQVFESHVQEQQVTVVFALRDSLISDVNIYVSDVPGTDGFFGGVIKSSARHNIPLANLIQKEDAAKSFLTAMKGNDWALMRSIMEPDIYWTLPGNSLLSGLASGVDAVIGRAQALKKFGVMFELLHIVYSWDGVALSLHNTGSRGALMLDEYVTIVFELDRARVTSLTTHLSDVPGIEQFFVPGIIS